MLAPHSHPLGGGWGPATKKLACSPLRACAENCLQPRPLKGHEDGLASGKEPPCKGGTSRFKKKNGFHAAITFVGPYKEAYSWRQNSLGGWKQYLVCSFFHSAWKVYRSPKERGDF